jgi:hypothetical protein
MVLPHIFTKYPRIGAVTARVRFPATFGTEGPTITGDSYFLVAHYPEHIFYRYVETNHLHTAQFGAHQVKQHVSWRLPALGRNSG